jgi:hypothetical protein
MLRCCIVCRAETSPDLTLQYCAACQSALYCSKACQRTDWKKQHGHKHICKLLNVGHGDMQVRSPVHTYRSINLKEFFEEEERSFDEEDKRFFKLFEESTFEGSRAAARKMKKIAKRHNTKCYEKFLLFHSLRILVGSDSEKLSWPSSPLLVLLQFVDPNVLSGNEDVPVLAGQTRETLFHHLADLADPSDYSTHENQLILANQLIEGGANVNVVTMPQGETILHRACSKGNVTNLDFIEILLEEGADPNSQDHMGKTPLMYTLTDAPGAAKFLLNWPTTDVNITTRSGASFLAWVRLTVKVFSDKIVRPDNPEQVQDQFLLQQWREIEDMLVERGAHDTGITALT